MESLGREEKHLGNLMIAQNRLGAFDGVARIGGGYYLGKLERADLVEIRAHRMTGSPLPAIPVS
jgi:hypothetical protein